MADYRDRLAARVTHERERRQLSRDELALAAGLNPKTIERIEERQVERPRGNTIRSLAAALGVDPADLNPPAELEEEQLARIEAKLDDALDLLRRLAGDDLAEMTAQAATAALAEADGQAEPRSRRRGAGSA